MAQFTGHVAIPTAIKIAFLPSFAVNAIPCRHAGRRKSGLRAMWGTKKPVREPLSIPRPARKNEIAGQTPYCADFLRLVHDEMLSAARARFSGWLCT